MSDERGPFAHLQSIDTKPYAALGRVHYEAYSMGRFPHFEGGDDARSGERVWFATAGLQNLPDSGAVLIPACGLESMTDEEIARGVRRLAAVSNRLFEGAFLKRLFGRQLGRMTEEFAHLTLDEFREQTGFALEWAEWQSDSFSRSLRAEIKAVLHGHNREAGFIYVLSDGQGHFKIGRTKCLSSRVKQLSAQPPFEIKLIGAFRAVNAAYFERAEHVRLAASRKRGEWFTLTAEQVAGVLERARTFYDINGEEITGA